MSDSDNTKPLFKAFPTIAAKTPVVSLGKFPTPIEKMARMAESLNIGSLFIKRDDLSGVVYGGNKVRKLEFLFPDALRNNTKDVFTFGFAGSNHALATAIYAKQLGLKCVSMLMRQPNARYLQTNLLASLHFGAELIHYGNIHTLTLDATPRILRSFIKHGVYPGIIPAGGSSPRGILGYVNATFELKEQIDAGRMPEPDFIYVPMGSMGTSIGLKIGFKALEMKTKVIPVRVIEEKMASPKRMLRLMRKTVDLLQKNAPDFPEIRMTGDELMIRDDCLGNGYAVFTRKARDAARLMKIENGLTMNGTYSAKALSALVDDAEKGLLENKTVLFWNTYNSRDIAKFTEHVDYHSLPKKFHGYFENPAQTLDLDS